jgi:hypothetical protein
VIYPLKPNARLWASKAILELWPKLAKLTIFGPLQRFPKSGIIPLSLDVVRRVAHRWIAGSGLGDGSLNRFRNCLCAP